MAERSSLNPNAEPYIPLSGRANAEQDSKNDDDTPYSISEHLLRYDVPSSSSVQRVMDWLDANADEDIARLKTMFPDIVESSISHVYTAHEGNVERTIEMLRRLRNSLRESPRSAATAEGSTSSNPAESSTKT